MQLFETQSFSRYLKKSYITEESSHLKGEQRNYDKKSKNKETEEMREKWKRKKNLSYPHPFIEHIVESSLAIDSEEDPDLGVDMTPLDNRECRADLGGSFSLLNRLFCLVQVTHIAQLIPYAADGYNEFSVYDNDNVNNKNPSNATNNTSGTTENDPLANNVTNKSSNSNTSDNKESRNTRYLERVYRDSTIQPSKGDFSPVNDPPISYQVQLY
jgi:hypothetical protein